MLCFAAIAIIAAISAACPYRCTGTIAFVFGVMAFSMATGSILNVLGSTSTKTGFSLSNAMTSVVAIKVNDGVITSSPGCRSERHQRDL